VFRFLAVDGATGTPLVPADVQSVYASVFLPDEYQGDAIAEFFPSVATTIKDPVVFDGIDPDGSNGEVFFDMVSSGMDGGGRRYVLEVVVERKTGERVPFRGRVVTRPMLSLPL